MLPLYYIYRHLQGQSLVIWGSFFNRRKSFGSKGLRRSRPAPGDVSLYAVRGYVLLMVFFVHCRKIHQLPVDFFTAHDLNRQTSMNAPVKALEPFLLPTLLLSTLAGLWA